MTEPEPEAATAEPAVKPWTIVTQVKSNRVVYFTDDPSYEPLMDGDWYYVSIFHEALPKGMTPRNCWRWRFTGGRFTDAGAPRALPQAEKLLEANRKALRQILAEKIDAIRAPFAPSCRDGDTLRAMKREEARAFLAGNIPAGTALPLLEAVALARRCTLLEAAQFILAKDTEYRALLTESERFREQLARAIDAASTQARLLEVREWLLDSVYPELTQRFRLKLVDTEPLDLNQALDATQRTHEITRLKARLRELVNEARKPLHSDYIRNDDARRRKLRLAQLVATNLNAGRLAEAVPPGMGVDFDPLRIYAEARGLTLAEAADLLLRSAEVTEAILDQTERLKDRLLVRIEAVRSLNDAKTVAREAEEAFATKAQPGAAPAAAG
ncbi:MAG: hypothetical protein ING16_14075 [Roseomonas sp.]|nr:hypothetical protein [Roseomonas sp.]